MPSFLTQHIPHKALCSGVLSTQSGHWILKCHWWKPQAGKCVWCKALSINYQGENDLHKHDLAKICKVRLVVDKESWDTWIWSVHMVLESLHINWTCMWIWTVTMEAYELSWAIQMVLGDNFTTNTSLSGFFLNITHKDWQAVLKIHARQSSLTNCSFSICPANNPWIRKA